MQRRNGGPRVGDQLAVIGQGDGTDDRATAVSSLDGRIAGTIRPAFVPLSQANLAPGQVQRRRRTAEAADPVGLAAVHELTVPIATPLG